MCVCVCVCVLFHFFECVNLCEFAHEPFRGINFLEFVFVCLCVSVLACSKARGRECEYFCTQVCKAVQSFTNI